MQNNINNKVSELKKELEQISIDDTAAKAHIDELIQDIENSNDSSLEANNLIIDKIKMSIDRFETEHPRATAILNDIMVTLSNMGI